MPTRTQSPWTLAASTTAILFMFEFHGWTRISYHSHDTDMALQNRCFNQCEDYVSKHPELSPDNYKFTRANGVDSFAMMGLYNHFASHILEIFEWIGQNASGSYGILYVSTDDEQTGISGFKVYIMQRGKVREAKDPFLSPRVPTIEDPYDSSRCD